VGSVNGVALPALSCHVWKCIVSVGPMLSSTRITSGSDTRSTSEGYRLEPPCSMNPKWNPAVLAIAWMCFSGLRSSSFRGIAGNLPFSRPGTAGGKVSPRSGFFVRLR
jgi:hypothetical protein